MRGVRRAGLVAVAVIAFASVANAADMPVKTAGTVAVPSYNWTGFYGGAVGAHGWADSQHCQVLPPGVRSANCDPSFPQTNMSGWLGGGTIGYNNQWSAWVLGVEGDWSWGKLKGVSHGTATFVCLTTCDTSISSVGTVRGRVGYAYDRFLPYLTAGAAFSRLKADVAPGTAFNSSGTTTKTDFVWGGGLEYAFWQNLSAKIEYLNITKLGDFTYDKAASCGVATPCYVHVSNVNLARLGLNYKFWAGP